MIRTKPYEFMVTYTPQQEWIERGGIMLWLAFFFSEFGAGIYFVSLFFEFPLVRLTGWLISLVLGGALHMAYLGRPTRGWRILLHPSTSELSRGLWLLLLFGVIGFFQVVPVVFPALPWDGGSLALRIPMGVICILVVAHGFTTMNAVSAIPSWNLTMMIPLSVISGIWIGSQFVEVTAVFGGADITGVEMWSRWLLFCYMAASALYLWGIMNADMTARASAKRILAGDKSAGFYIGVVIIGIIIPLIITLALWGDNLTGAGPGLFLLRLVCILIGDLALRYLILRCGMYSPLIPSSGQA